jgi:hypothetical protein
LKNLRNLFFFKFGEDFDTAYHRSDFMGKCARKLLYMPNESEKIIKSKRLAKNLIREYNDDTNDFGCSTTSKPRLSLRHLASHRFLLYFLLSFVFTKTITGYSMFFSFLLVGFFFFLFTLYKN